MGDNSTLSRQSMKKSSAVDLSVDSRYSGVCFHIFYCNSAGLSNVGRSNGVFVTAGFVIVGGPTVLQCLITILFQHQFSTAENMFTKSINWRGDFKLLWTRISSVYNS